VLNRIFNQEPVTRLGFFLGIFVAMALWELLMPFTSRRGDYPFGRSGDG
jgi:hypothetical protein